MRRKKTKQNKKSLEQIRRIHRVLALIVCILIFVDMFGLKIILAASTANIGACLTIYKSPYDNKPCAYSENKSENTVVPSFQIKGVDGESKKAQITDFSISSNKIIEDGKFVNLAIIGTDDNKPVFSGVVNVPNSYAHFGILNNEKYISGSAQIDSSGCWEWKSPASLSSGEAKLYLSVSESREPPLDDYYVANFSVGSERVGEIDDPIRKTTKEETRKLKETIKIYTLLGVDSSTRDIAPGSNVKFAFDVSGEFVASKNDEVVLRLRRPDGVILEERTINLNRENLPLRSEFKIKEKSDLGVYYIESLMKIGDNYVSDIARFNVVYKKNVPFFGIVNVASYQDKVILTILSYSLLMFFIILGREIYILKKIKNAIKIEGIDLKKSVA